MEKRWVADTADTLAAKDHKDTPDLTGSRLRSLRSFVANPCLPSLHRVVAHKIESAAKDHKDHKETPDPTGFPLCSLRSFAANPCLPSLHRVLAPNIASAAKDHKGHKDTPDPTGSPLRSLRSFAAIQPSTFVSLQNPNQWSAWIGITFPLEKLRDLLPN